MPEENIEKITKSNSNFAPPFVDLYLLPDIDFNWNFLINDNISISKYIFRDTNIYLEIYKYISINIYLEIYI